MNYDREKYKVWDWKNLMILHWMINPGLAFNELILGQTIPKVILIERGKEKPFYQRSFVPCPHCGTLHNSLKWSFRNKTALGNWYGYYCDQCKEIIPVQRNLTSLIILGITFPIWGWFRKSLKQNWLNRQADRYKNINLDIAEKQKQTKKWLKSGLFYGVFMYISMIIIFPLMKGEEITLRRLLIGIPFWHIGGLGWGYLMKRWMNKIGKK